MIIGLIGLKGGVGASTLAVNLATYLAERYDDVTLVEGEETGYNSLDYWGEARQSEIPFGVIRVSEEDIQLAEYEDLREYLMHHTGTHNDVIVIDVNRNYSKLRLLAFSAADVVLLPATPGSIVSERRLEEIKEMLEPAIEAPATNAISETSEEIQRSPLGLPLPERKPTKPFTRVSVDLPLELHLGFKLKCSEQCITMQDALEALIKWYVERNEREALPTNEEDTLPKRPELLVRLLKNRSAIHPSEIDGFMRFENCGLKYMGTEVKDRDAVRVAFDKGLGITEYEPQGPAALELRQLVDEIMELPAHS